MTYPYAFKSSFRLAFLALMVAASSARAMNPTDAADAESAPAPAAQVSAFVEASTSTDGDDVPQRTVSASAIAVDGDDMEASAPAPQAPTIFSLAAKIAVIDQQLEFFDKNRAGTTYLEIIKAHIAANKTDLSENDRSSAKEFLGKVGMSFHEAMKYFTDYEALLNEKKPHVDAQLATLENVTARYKSDQTNIEKTLAAITGMLASVR